MIRMRDQKKMLVHQFHINPFSPFHWVYLTIGQQIASPWTGDLDLKRCLLQSLQTRIYYEYDERIYHKLSTYSQSAAGLKG